MTFAPIFTAFPPTAPRLSPNARQPRCTAGVTRPAPRGCEALADASRRRPGCKSASPSQLLFSVRCDEAPLIAARGAHAPCRCSAVGGEARGLLWEADAPP